MSQMSLCIGLVPFEVAPTVLTLAKYQLRTMFLISVGRAEVKTRFIEHQALTPGEQYRRHISQGGYRP